MTPPATAAARLPGRASQGRTVAPRVPRRVSGPARPARGTVAVGGGSATAPLGLRLARRARALPDARVLDRLARGRLWIAVLAVGLTGIVFLQISLLKLNTGISRAVQTSQTLERQNTELQMDVSRLGGGDRLADSAAAMGFVLPATGQPAFLDARKATAARAAAGISTPAPIEQLPLGMIPPAQGGTSGMTPAPVSAAPATAAATPATGTAAATPAPGTTAPATTTQTPTPAPAATVAPSAQAAAPVQAVAPTPTPTPTPAATPVPQPAAAGTGAPPTTLAAGGAAVPQG